MVRSSVLETKVPDAAWNPVYTAETLNNDYFEKWDAADRSQGREIGSRRTIYVVTQWTLDFFFPIVAGVICLCLARRLLPRKFFVFAVPAIALAIVFDWGENLMLSILAWNGAPARPSWLVSLSGFCTRVKYLLFVGTFSAVLVLSATVPTWMIYVRARKSRSRTDACWHTLGKIWNSWMKRIARLVELRFPLLAIATLLFWAPIACFSSGLRPLAGNVLLVENVYQVASLAWINGLAIIFSIAMLRKLCHIHRSAIDPNYRTRKWTVDIYLVALLMSAVAPVIAVHYSHEQLALWRETGFGGVFLAEIAISVAGFLLSLGTTWFLVVIMGALYGNVAGDQNFFPFEDRDQKALFREQALPHHSEWKMVSYFVLLFICYALALPNVSSFNDGYLSISAYVVILTWMLAMILSGMSAFLDRTRIPIVALLILLVVALRVASDRANYLPAAPLLQPSSLTSAVHKLVKAEQLQQNETGEPDPDVAREVEQAKQELEDLAWRAVRARMLRKRNSARPEGKKVLTVITCPGGGIHAAAWSAYVLEQLDRRYADFSDSIVVISGVSGGSVGTVFFANSRYSSDTSQPLDGHPWRLASKSSLEAIGQAVVFHDLPSALFPPIRQQLLPLPGIDRGIGLENSWKERLDAVRKDSSLEAWGTLAVEGEMPIIVLNAMDAVSGRRVLFGSVPTPRRRSLDGRTGRPWDYRELIRDPKTDLHVATAARASASFPYVSPFTRPEQSSNLGMTVALGDGGYSDNEGIVTAIDWLDFIAQRALLERQQNNVAERLFDRVLLLRIQPGSDADAPPPDSESQLVKIQSQFRWLSGPLEALASMRTTSQVERGQLEVDLAVSPPAQYWLEESAAGDDPAAPPDAEVRATSPKRSSARPSIQSELDRGNIAIQRSIQSQAKSREALLERQIELLQQDIEPPAPPAVPALKSVMQELTTQQPDDDEPPLLICTIPFVAPEPDADVPLNWKLSPRQLTWYRLAWDSLIQTATDPAAGESVSFLALLDAMFEMRPEDQR